MTSERSGFYPHVQGLRAVAVVLVVLFHAGFPLPGGFVGVDVFFVISGFVITSMLNRELADTGTLALGSFYRRRIKRIAPALAVMLLLVLAASFVFQSPFGAQQDIAAMAVAASVSLANFAIAQLTGGYFGADAESNPLLHTWSLAVEEQFYVLFPTLLLLMWWSGRRLNLRSSRLLPIVGILVVSVCSLWTALTPVLTSRLSDTWLWIGEFYGPIPRIWEFGVGALIALVPTALPASTRRFLGLCGVALLAISCVGIDGDTRFPGPATLIPTMGAALLIINGSDNRVGAILSSRPFVHIGDVSYSWYLQHWPLIVFTRLLWPDQEFAPVVAAGLSYLLALLVFRLVEQPFRVKVWRYPRRTAVAFAVLIIAPFPLAWSLHHFSTTKYNDPTLEQFAAQREPQHAGINAGCNFHSDTLFSGACTFPGARSATPVYLVGDSNGDQYSEGLIAAGRVLQRPVSIGVAYGCLFLDIEYLRTDKTLREQQRCKNYMPRVLSRLQQLPRGVVVIGNSDRVWRDPNWLIGAERPTADPLLKRRLLTDAYVRTFRTLQTWGFEVLMVQTIPHFSEADPWQREPYAWDPAKCTFRKSSPQPCAFTMPLSAADTVQADSRHAIASAASAASIKVLDFRDVICPERLCSTYRDGVLIYRDQAHISVAAARLLTPSFLAALR